MSNEVLIKNKNEVDHSKITIHEINTNVNKLRYYISY